MCHRNQGQVLRIERRGVSRWIPRIHSQGSVATLFRQVHANLRHQLSRYTNVLIRGPARVRPLVYISKIVKSPSECWDAGPSWINRASLPVMASYIQDSNETCQASDIPRVRHLRPEPLGSSSGEVQRFALIPTRPLYSRCTIAPTHHFFSQTNDGARVQNSGNPILEPSPARLLSISIRGQSLPLPYVCHAIQAVFHASRILASTRHVERSHSASGNNSSNRPGNSVDSVSSSRTQEQQSSSGK